MEQVERHAAARKLIQRGQVAEGEKILRSLNNRTLKSESVSSQHAQQALPSTPTARVCFCWGKHDTWSTPLSTPRTPTTCTSCVCGKHAACALQAPSPAEESWPHLTPRVLTPRVRDSPNNVDVSADEFSRILKVHLLCGSYALCEEEKEELERRKLAEEERTREQQRRQAERKEEEKRRKMEERQQVCSCSSESHAASFKDTVKTAQRASIESQTFLKVPMPI